MRIVFMGSPEFAVSPLQTLILNGHEIAAVYTRLDKPAGRGRESIPPPMKNAALSMNLTVVQVPSLKKLEAIEQLAGFKPDAVVVAAFGQILPQAVLDIPLYGCINIHPSLLPKYRGPSPVISTLLAGDEFAGVSVMRLDAGMDTGPIFSQGQIPVMDIDNNITLTDKLFQIGAGMLVEVLAFLPQGKIRPVAQNDAQASVSKEVVKEEGKINWAQPAREIWFKVRAFQPWPEAFTYWQGKQVKIIEAVPISGAENPETGRVVPLAPPDKVTGAAFGVNTGKGILGIIKLQSEGKKIMSAEEFLRGQRNILGAVLG
jgi:methionyl-tRNA formyltransferase